MARKPKTLVLDSWAILAYLGDEAASHEVAELLASAHEQRTPLLMATVNVGEVWYILARESSESDADRALSDLRTLSIQFVDADWELTKRAARIKAKFRMSYSDCFAAALAVDRKAELATGDPEFKKVEEFVAVQNLVLSAAMGKLFLTKFYRYIMVFAIRE
jgi:predicted nucleic acid-binding protein